MCRNDIGDDKLHRGKGWTQVNGELSYISVGYGPVLWGVDYGHDVWYKKLGDIKVQAQTGWISVPKPDTTKKMVYLDVGRDGRVWGVDDQSRIYERTGVDANTK